MRPHSNSTLNFTLKSYKIFSIPQTSFFSSPRGEYVLRQNPDSRKVKTDFRFELSVKFYPLECKISADTVHHASSAGGHLILSKTQNFDPPTNVSSKPRKIFSTSDSFSASKFGSRPITFSPIACSTI